MKYFPRTESRGRENESAFKCDSGYYVPIPYAGSLPLSSKLLSVACIAYLLGTNMDGITGKYLPAFGAMTDRQYWIQVAERHRLLDPLLEGLALSDECVKH